MANQFNEAFGMVAGGLAVDHNVNMSGKYDVNGFSQAVHNDVANTTHGLVSNVINTMRRSSDGGLDQLTGMDSNQIIGISYFTW